MGDDQQRIETEHVEVHRLAEQLAAPKTLLALRRDVRALMSFLPAHFQREERDDGLFATAAALAPAEAWRFDEIRERHARILEELEDLFTLVDRGGGFDSARGLARSLSEQLVAHDQLETTWLRVALAQRPHA